MTKDFDKNIMVLISEYKGTRTNLLADTYSTGKESKVRVYEYTRINLSNETVKKIVVRIGNSSKVHTLNSYSEKHTMLAFNKQLWYIEK